MYHRTALWEKRVKNQCMTERVWGMFLLISYLTCSFIFIAHSFSHSFTGITICYSCQWMLTEEATDSICGSHISSYWVFKGGETKGYHPAVEERVLPWACLWYLKLNPWMGRLLFITWNFRETSVQFSSVTQSCLTLCDPWTEACQASLSITNSWSLLKLTVHWVSDAIHPSHPLSSPSLAFILSQHQGVFK